MTGEVQGALLLASQLPLNALAGQIRPHRWARQNVFGIHTIQRTSRRAIAGAGSQARGVLSLVEAACPRNRCSLEAGGVA
jgi:hypothetical protein